MRRKPKEHGSLNVVEKPCRNWGVRYDFKGEFLKKVTNQQLEGMGLLGDHLRGSTSPEADLIGRAKARYTTATKKGYDGVLDRFSKDAVFAAKSFERGRK